MSFFDQTIPADTESVKLGAQRVRDLKTWLNATLGLLFTNNGSNQFSWLTNVIPGSALQNASVTSAQLANLAITPALLAPGAYSYAPGTYSPGYTGGTALATNAVTGTGSSCTVTPTVVNGLVTSVAVVAGGSGYAVNDTILPVDATGVGCVLKVTAISGSAVSSLSVVNQGNQVGSYTINLSPAPSAYVAGMTVKMVANLANTLLGVATTLVIPGVASPIPILKYGNVPLAANDIYQGQAVEFILDGSGNAQILGPFYPVPAARPSEAKAWVRFDGACTQPTCAFPTSGGVFTGNVITLSAPVANGAGTQVTLPAGQAVTLSSGGTLPSQITTNTSGQATVYYVASAGSNTTYHVYVNQSDAVAQNSNYITFSGSTSGYTTTGTTFNAILLFQSYNVVGVIRTYNDTATGASTGAGQAAAKCTYEVLFQNPLSANFATVGNAAAFGNNYAVWVVPAATSPNVTTKKRIWTIGCVTTQTDQFNVWSNEVNVSFFAN